MFPAGAGTALLRKIAATPDDAANGSSRLRPCENMISDAGIGQQRWLAPAGARGQAAIACIFSLRRIVFASAISPSSRSARSKTAR